MDCTIFCVCVCVWGGGGGGIRSHTPVQKLPHTVAVVCSWWQLECWSLFIYQHLLQRSMGFVLTWPNCSGLIDPTTGSAGIHYSGREGEVPTGAWGEGGGHPGLRGGATIANMYMVLGP